MTILIGLIGLTINGLYQEDLTIVIESNIIDRVYLKVLKLVANIRNTWIIKVSFV